MGLGAEGMARSHTLAIKPFDHVDLLFLLLWPLNGGAHFHVIQFALAHLKFSLICYIKLYN
jgi:hypothetical protein